MLRTGDGDKEETAVNTGKQRTVSKKGGGASKGSWKPGESMRNRIFRKGLGNLSKNQRCFICQPAFLAAQISLSEHPVPVARLCVSAHSAHTYAARSPLAAAELQSLNSPYCFHAVFIGSKGRESEESLPVRPEARTRSAHDADLVKKKIKEVPARQSVRSL